MTDNIFTDFESNRDYTIQLLDGISSAVSLFTVSSEIKFLHFNRAAAQLFNYEPQELLELTGKDPMQIFHPDYVDQISSEIIATMRDGRMFNYDCRIACKDGNFTWVNFSAQLVQQSSGTLYYHGVLTPIDEPDNILLKGLHALIVAGNESDRDQLSALIEQYGGTCDVYNRGLDALDRFENSSDNFYQCVFIGYKMKDINGFELIKDIRHGNHLQSPSIPLLMLTEDIDENLPDIGDIGITAYLKKPLNSEKIIKWLKKLNK